MSEKKLCKDCRHFIDWQICHHPALRVIDPVCGKSIKRAHYERMAGRCGSSAEFFQPKPPRRTFWQWLTGQQPA